MRSTGLKYFLYARKSSESEDRQMASIEDQIREVLKLAEKYNINVVDVIEESKSAKEPGRPLFNNMLKRIHKGEAQGILTWKLNRLARNPIDGGQISWMLQRNIIKHIQTFERDYNPSDNVLLMQVEFGMANQYVKDLSIDVKRGMRQKAERGWYPLSKLPIGYEHNSKYMIGVDSEIIPHKDQFQIIKKLWQYLLTGNYSVADIRKLGNIMGLKSNLNKPFSKSAYYRLFSNEFYCGYYYWPDKDGNMVRFKGRHKEMISTIEFQKAQIILNRNTGTFQKKKEYDFPFRGIIKCGECGCSVTPDHKLQVICTNCKFKFSIINKSVCQNCKFKLSQMVNPVIIDILYYHCNKSRGKCAQKSITKNQIENQIEIELSKITISQDFYQWAMGTMKQDEAEKQEKENEMRKLNKVKLGLESRLSQLVNLRADGEINKDQFNISVENTNNEISSIELKIHNIQKENFEWIDEKEKSYLFALNVLERFQNGTNLAKSEIVKGLSSNLTLLDKKLDIITKKSLLEIKNSLATYSRKSEFRT